MNRTRPEFEVDLRVEHNGQLVRVEGSGNSFSFSFHSIRSALHWLSLWPSVRALVPAEIGLDVRLWGIRIPWKRSRLHR